MIFIIRFQNQPFLVIFVLGLFCPLLEAIENFQTTSRRLQFLCFCFVVVVVVLHGFQFFCSMTAAISLLLSVVYQRVIVKSCDVYFQLPHLPEAALETIISVFSVLVKINCQFLQSCMEHAELSSSVIFVCHVNFSRRLEAESAAISVLFVFKFIFWLFAIGVSQSRCISAETKQD